VDLKPQKSAEKRWNWVRRGAPLIVEIGPRDAAGGQVTFIRRDKLRDGERVNSSQLARDAFVAQVPAMLADMQKTMFDEAKLRLDANILTGMKSFAEIADYFGAAGDEDEGSEFKGWVRAPWSRPTADALAGIEAKLKSSKLTLRNVPQDQSGASGKCVFTGGDAIEEILISRAY
jgi:prolyl-tRNA synthetase